jgi:hypothetical protein
MPRKISFIFVAVFFCSLTNLIAQDIIIVERPKKICQLVGEYDKERNEETINRTKSRYRLYGTDLGVPFTHHGRTYILFGDTVGIRGGDAIAYTTDTNPEDCLRLDFIQDDAGAYKPIKIPGISQGGFEVPTEGVSVNGKMYIYHTTDSTKGKPATMGRSVVAVSNDDGKTFKYLYNFSRKHFINLSIVEVDSVNWPGLPSNVGRGLVIFGSGPYRRSNVRLAFEPADNIETGENILYFAGLDGTGIPSWSENELDAQELFNQPCVGELSVSYNKFIRKWIMLYNCFLPGGKRGINMRTADYPWGPWSESEVLFDPWKDGGYCHFMHTSWSFKQCDHVEDSPKRGNEWGGEYGPYQYEDFAIGGNNATTIYFNLSTWNPYTVVLMKATLKRLD